MKTYKNNLVILCEGTDTEYLYFSELKEYVLKNAPDRYTTIKIVPVPEEIIRSKNPKRKDKVRKLEVDAHFHYYCKYEHLEEDYRRYCAQPIRYVREVYLFMQEDGYTEGWAVFDNDNHPALEEAFSYAEQAGVKIAFSSYSFEEWFLAHFERCPFAFHHSECKLNGKDVMCGTHVSTQGDCHGLNCIGGRLRDKGYIPDYTKSKKGVFSQYTLPFINKALINAAWLRNRANGVIWESNPYTDVDVLVAKMLRLSKYYSWHGIEEEIRFAGSAIRLSTVHHGGVMMNNAGDVAVLINKNDCSFLMRDESLMPFRERLLLAPGEVIHLNIPSDAIALIINNGSRSFIIDLDNG